VGLKDKLRELAIELPPPVPPGGLYNPVMFHGGLAYISGQVPLREGQLVARGKLGEGVTIEEGQAAARLCVLNALAALDQALGSLDGIDRPLKMTVFVASGPGFNDQAQVANGASQVLIDLFGFDNRPARSAVGVAELPLGCPVEVELTFALSGSPPG
jgi:enamine deaminase RidA (YjgF/YER057c/UK114 family)